MSELFLHVLNASLSAGWIILAVLVLRMAMKKTPRWISVILWGVVALRLIIPFSFKSVLSLIPSAEVVSPDIMMDATPTVNTGIPVVNDAVNPIITGSFSPAMGDSANPLQILIPILATVWAVGAVALLLYAAVSYIVLTRKVSTATRLKDNIYQSERVPSPFVLGVFRPKIYLPFTVSVNDAVHVIAHEKAHLQRGDHIWKPLGFILLSVHWFNPLMWIGYILLCKDIELACDERVIKDLGRDARADYSEALLSCNISKRSITACPIAFGESGVKTRVRTVLNYKKPAFWVVIVAVVICAALAVCFLTDPIDHQKSGIHSFDVKNISVGKLELSFKYSSMSGRYSVRCVDVEEGEYSRDGMTDYDGSLGEYRIMIELEDAELSEEFKNRFPNGAVVSLDSLPVEVRIKAVDLGDDRTVIYLGMDNALIVDDRESLRLGIFGGTVRLEIYYYAFTYFLTPGPEDGWTSFNSVYSFGCEVQNVSASIRYVGYNGGVVFEILWRNKSEGEYEIGPGFELYRHDGEKFVKLENKKEWENRRYMVSPTETVAYSYNLNEHYDISEPGDYRFEAHGAYVEFTVGEPFYSNIIDTATFDIDGDGRAEVCTISYGPTYGVFSFHFTVREDGNEDAEYFDTRSTQHGELSFKMCEDGAMRLQLVRYNGKTHLFDISVNGGRLMFTENGVSIDEIK